MAILSNGDFEPLLGMKMNPLASQEELFLQMLGTEDARQSCQMDG